MPHGIGRLDFKAVNYQLNIYNTKLSLRLIAWKFPLVEFAILNFEAANFDYYKVKNCPLP